MSHLTAKEVGERLARAGRLELKPLCVYGADEVPPGVVTVPDVVKAGHRCLAKALLLVAAGEAEGIYVGPGAMKDVCPGALSWLGLTAFPEDICNDLSTGGAPKHTAFLGPTAPDGNPWFPRDLMALSMPAKIACRMAADVDRSFVVKCAETTFPTKRDAEVAKAIAQRAQTS